MAVFEHEEISFQQKLREEIISAEERERRHLAQSLHDQLGQPLAIVKMKLEQARSSVSDETAPLRDDLTETLRLVDEVIQQVRTLTFDLYPTILDDLGLLPALEWYLDDFSSKTGIQGTMIKIGPDINLSESVAAYLFRAVKELLNNILKHAGASKVVVTVHGSNDKIRIVTDDDGKGFDADFDKTSRTLKGLGLFGVKKQAISLGGRLEIESTPGEGARVIIEIPV